jgi:UDP-glucose:glycoprotein glucosyltransferase
MQLRAGCAGPGCAGFGGLHGKQKLAGYGVSLNVKNMEYKAQNDEEVKAEHAASVAASGKEGAEEDVRGFMFSRLGERHPALKGELDTFRDHLLSNANQEATLKVWDLKDLGLQATQRIASGAEPLRLLVDISHNFPSLASSLSRMQARP